jgi:hypothetical protein
MLYLYVVAGVCIRLYVDICIRCNIYVYVGCNMYNMYSYTIVRPLGAFDVAIAAGLFGDRYKFNFYIIKFIELYTFYSTKPIGVRQDFLEIGINLTFILLNLLSCTFYSTKPIGVRQDFLEIGINLAFISLNLLGCAFYSTKSIDVRRR